MSVLCRLFGHRLPRSPYSDAGPYLTLRAGGVDGLGVQHAHIHGMCPRCEEKFRVCSVHMPSNRDETAFVELVNEVTRLSRILDAVERALNENNLGKTADGIKAMREQKT